MRAHAAFHTLIVFTTVLTFSAPFVTLAQQNPIQTEAEVAAGLLAAKTAAEQDASNDVNRLLWFGAGMGLAAMGITVGALTGCLVGSAINPETEGWYGVPVPNEAQVIGPLVGSTLGCLASPIGISRYSSNPPVVRLLGKSPEYVEAYTNAYRAKARSLRTSSATVGAAIVGGGLGLCLFGSIQ
ncbi:MAG: hypothetical protein OYL97_10810 [Candidatus Poribacteria bacterium]|nr:hypothetical protein [Candidatus Poribacteria bacterium]MDE0467538.1 hypothetical protein [Candidatus Poribacteria bacterium]